MVTLEWPRKSSLIDKTETGTNSRPVNCEKQIIIWLPWSFVLHLVGLHPLCKTFVFCFFLFLTVPVPSSCILVSRKLLFSSQFLLRLLSYVGSGKIILTENYTCSVVELVSCFVIVWTSKCQNKSIAVLQTLCRVRLCCAIPEQKFSLCQYFLFTDNHHV